MIKARTPLGKINEVILELVQEERGWRSAEVLRKYEGGYTIEEIAIEDSLSYDIVRQILVNTERFLFEQLARPRLSALIKMSSRDLANEEQVRGQLAEELRTSRTRDTGYSTTNYESDLEVLNLHTRIQKLLVGNGIETVAELCDFNKKRLSIFRGLGEKAIETIILALAKEGLALKEDEPEKPRRVPYRLGKYVRW